ncbi:NmrA family NAD(P)-binding protein [Ensifer aridi]|uniref:NmrA family NAD(P)-binding protein n=1 Tax=Ensifer aridi TaxID=1708715 RepID=UPI000A11D2FF|nr:NmrA family NAD(P)-binding protein [Ensifer aridi]
MYVVLGANGRAGGEVARALIERGEAVRVVLRSKEQGEKWTALGAEVAVATIEDADTMADALKGASGAFLLNPPPVSGDPYARTEEFGAALSGAAPRARLPKAVVLSSIGAQHASGTGVIATLNRFEALLDGVAPATVFLRSGYFVETWGEVAQTVMSESVLPTFIEPSQRIPMVSTIDVGRAAAAVLCEEWTGKRVVELAGPEDWSAGDVASAFAEVLGRPVVPVPVPPERRAALLAEEGVPGEVANALLGMYEGIAKGLFMHQNGSEHRRGTISLMTAIERVVARLNQPTADLH